MPAEADLPLPFLLARGEPVGQPCLHIRSWNNSTLARVVGRLVRISRTSGPVKRASQPRNEAPFVFLPQEIFAVQGVVDSGGPRQAYGT